MSIARKILLYTIGIISLIAVIIIGYFSFMLPPLYADYKDSERIQAMKQMQTSQIRNNYYDQKSAISEVLPTHFIFKVDKDTHIIEINQMYFKATVEITDQQLIAFFKEYETLFGETENLTEDQVSKKMEAISSRFFDYIKAQEIFNTIENNELFTVEFTAEPKDTDMIYQQSKGIFHQNGENAFIIEAQVKDVESYYTSYIGLAQDTQNYYISFATAMTPKLNELQPVIYSMLPTISMIALLLVSIATFLFSKVFITPIKKLVQLTEQMKNNYYHPLDKKSTKNNDEFAILTEKLDSLYTELQASIQVVEAQKNSLEQKNKQQELFLTASTHELKTPITAGLLLVDSMKNNIGKYKDHDTYLPELKKELLRMQGIVSEILELQHVTLSNDAFERVNVTALIDGIMGQYITLLQSKNIQLSAHLDAYNLTTQPILLAKIMDNILHNAIKYTPNGKHIYIKQIEHTIIVENTGIQINEHTLSSIFEPFVRDVGTQGGHGLGLYIADYYAKLLDISLEIENTQHNSVITRITFMQKHS